MKCPIDQTDLVITDRQNIEIDYCPKCRGVWLDRGELDKIVERSESSDSSREPERRHEDKHNYNERYSDDNHRPHKKKKRESFLGDLFEF